MQIDMSSTPCSTRPTPAHIYTMYMSTAQEVLGPAAPTHIPTSHAAQDCTSLHICPLCIPLCPCTYTPATPHTRLHAHAHGPAACAHMACSACAHSPPTLSMYACSAYPHAHACSACAHTTPYTCPCALQHKIALAHAQGLQHIPPYMPPVLQARQKKVHLDFNSMSKERVGGR